MTAVRNTGRAAPDSGSSPERRLSRLPVFASRSIPVCALLASAYFLHELLSFEYGRDQGIYAVVAEAILRGGAPYKDAWDFKPPGIYFVYAFARAVFGKGMEAIRLVEASALASLLWAFALFSRRHVGNAAAGILGGALAVKTLVELGYWHTGQPETFGAVAVAWALVFATYEDPVASRPASRRELLAWWLAGLLYGLAASMKPPFLGAAAVSAAFAVATRWQATPREDRGRLALRVSAAFASGAFLPFLALAAFFHLHDAWAQLHGALFVFAPNYTAIGFRAGNFPLYLGRASLQLVLTYSWLVVAGVLAWLALPPRGRRERIGAAHVGGILLVQLAGIALQAKFFHYHYGGALPLLALLAGWGYWKLVHVDETRGFGLALALLLFASLWGLPRPGTPTASVGDKSKPRFTSGKRYNTPRKQVAAWLSRNLPEGSTFFVWGFEPFLYDLLGRLPPTRYIYNVPQRAAWSAEPSRKQLVRDLRRSPPAAIVVDTRDSIPWVTGNDRSSAEELETFPELREFLRRRYSRAARIGRFEIYLERGPRPR